MTASLLSAGYLIFCCLSAAGRSTAQRMMRVLIFSVKGRAV
jgi:hypothetical protein